MYICVPWILETVYSHLYCFSVLHVLHICDLCYCVFLHLHLQFWDKSESFCSFIQKFLMGLFNSSGALNNNASLGFLHNWLGNHQFTIV